MVRKHRKPKIWILPNIKHTNERHSKNFLKPTRADGLLGRKNLFSALTHESRLENKVKYLTPTEAIAQTYMLPRILKDHDIDRLAKDPVRLSKMHLNDTTLASEKSMIQSSLFYHADKSHRSKLSEADVLEIETFKSKLPEVKNIYENHRGFESRMSSFIDENVFRFKLFNSTMCELANSTIASDRQEKPGETSLRSPTSGSMTPQNTFIRSFHYDTMGMHELECKTRPETKQTEMKAYADALSLPSINQQHKKTYFCNVLGEKYCSECVECHQRRFAKVYENKYIRSSYKL
jgi:hypothetical protein